MLFQLFSSCVQHYHVPKWLISGIGGGGGIMFEGCLLRKEVSGLLRQLDDILNFLRHTSLNLSAGQFTQLEVQFIGLPNKYHSRTEFQSHPLYLMVSFESMLIFVSYLDNLFPCQGINCVGKVEQFGSYSGWEYLSIELCHLCLNILVMGHQLSIYFKATLATFL